MLSPRLTAFLSACEADDALRAFAAGRALWIHFRLTDSGEEFSLIFEQDVLKASEGAPSGEPDFVLKTTAATFDGVMSGRIGGASAAMSGKLRFSGDTMKAMALQKIQRDLIRLYNQTIET